MVTLVRHDLEFILKQIRIAEQNATHIGVAGQIEAGTPLSELIEDPHLPYGLRYVDGSFNNLVPGRENFGAADQVMPRVTDPVFQDADPVSFDLDGPGPMTVGTPTSYTQNSGYVFDSDPRTISNLIVDQTLANPAAIAAALTHAGFEGADITANIATITARYQTYQADVAAAAGDQALIDAALQSLQSDLADGYGFAMDGPSLVLPNVSPDEGLTAPFNSWFTLFGQFFDHGLDLIGKGQSGTVFMALQPDDPLYVEGGHANFMVLTRATNQPGPDGIVGTADDVHEHVNSTTPWIDQNQTYTSHASHQVFLRDYDLVNGKPMANGHLLESAKGGPATWLDTKVQAREMLGINLVDTDVLNVPLLATDEYGEFLRGPNGFALVVMRVGNGADGRAGTDDDVTTLVEGNPADPINLVGHVINDPTSPYNGMTASAVRTGHAFLDDIAHSAVPGTTFDHDDNPATPKIVVAEDTDTDTGNPIGLDGQGNKTAYDNELLDRHFITGDGRGNENIGLTAVHHVFHSEHNRLVDHTKDVALQSGDLAFINEWLTIDLPADFVPPTTEAGIEALKASLDTAGAWDGERLFQTARFATEMQYQHLVFEEFARKIQPAVDLFVFNANTDIDPAIVSEFANVIYRFGHSMLTQSIDRMDAEGNSDNIDLFAGFLNPIEFDQVDARTGAAAIIRGMTRQTGNEIDEFVTDVLRNQLVGLPLDLAALNIARARDTGVPSLNVARATFYEQSGSQWVKPYENWVDFAQNLKNPASVINFIAAYGTHASIVSAVTLADKRTAAMDLVFGGGAVSDAERLAFLRESAATSGVNAIDYWIGGLAEKVMPFGGMLGSSFMYVFEAQMENLQNNDRFYYLTRTQGLNLINELEANSFASLVKLNTTIGEGGPHVPGELFARVDHILEVNQALQIEADPSGQDPVLDALFPKVERVDPNDPANANYLRFHGGEHVVLGGTEQVDALIADDGDDTLWGDGGNDYLDGGAGVNHLHGGEGNDIIIDGGDISFMHGEEGDDVISAGRGAGELIFAGSGNDIVLTGDDGKEVFAGPGDDFILGGSGADFLLGNEGDDWIEAGDGFDTTAGDNSELFFNSTIIGHDVMFSGENEHDFDAESGDDIMVQGESVMRNEGMFGFDWVTHKGSRLAADIDFGRPIFTTDALDILRNRYDKVEGASGWIHDDIIIGDSRTGADAPLVDGVPVPPGQDELSLTNDVLTQAGVDRINGLRTILGVADSGNPDGVAYAGGNILLGGNGNDRITGKGGDDVIDGDAWLNVRVSIVDTNGDELATVDSLKDAISLTPDHPFYAEWNGHTLQSLMLSRAIEPEQLKIVREVLDGDTGNGSLDTAVYWDAVENYAITRNLDGSVTIQHVTVTAGVPDAFGQNQVSDGTDRLLNVEVAEFADGTIVALRQVAAVGQPVLSDLTPTEGQALTADISGISDLNGLPATFNYRWQSSTDGTNWTNIPGATNPGFTPAQAQVGRFLRLEVSFVDGFGSPEAVYSAPTAVVGDLINGNGGGNTLNGTAGADIINGAGGGDTLNGQAGDDLLAGDTGNDTVNGGAGDDTIVWNASLLVVNDGRDVVNGGTESVTGDTFVINGDGLRAETFRIYTKAAAVTAGIYPANGAAEIVITRTITNIFGNQQTAIIAELTEIEEIRVNTLLTSATNPPTGGATGGDTVQIIGDFSTTSLNLNTITIDGSPGDDTVDISQLDSAHRIVFSSRGGNDTIIGTLRSQDVIQLAPGAALADYAPTDNGNGTTTFSNGTHSITYPSSGAPTFEETDGAGSGGGEGGPASSFTLTQDDLDGLKAIVTGNTTGDEDFEATLGVRELSGVGNNIADPDRGTADQPFIRITDARYGAFDEASGNNAINPIYDGLDARAISNILGAQETDLPRNAAEGNIFFMAFGQYFDHGLDFLPKGGNGTIEIGGPGSGHAPGTDNPADLTRGTVHAIVEGVPQHLNLTSPYVDQNQAYGSNELVGQLLREGDGEGGLGSRLLAGAPDPSNPAYNLLPTLRELIQHHWENDTVFNGDQLAGGTTTFRTYYAGLVDEAGAIDGAMVTALAGNFMGTGHSLLLDANPYINLLDHFVAGDGRANENFSLTAIHTIWARNHNFHVQNLEQAGFDGTPEELFQAAKVINEAEYARVVFDEFADSLLGGMQGDGSHGFNEYNPDATAGISHEFAAAVYRVGHSLISDTITVIDANGQPKQVALFDAFLNPTNDASAFTMPLDQLAQFGYVPQPGYEQLGVSSIVAGTIGQQAEEVDFNIVNAVRNDLVRINADLFAFNVARGRDVGLGTLNQIRADLQASQDPYIREALGFAGNLDPYTSWEDFQARNGLSDTVINQFKQAYPDLVLDTPEALAAFVLANPDIELVNGNTVKGIDRVDLWVGGLAETHINDGMVGQTFWVVLHEQFDRLQEADRFYYIDRLDNFDFYENIIDGQNFADIIARNTGLTGLPERVFEVDDEDVATDGGNGEGAGTGNPGDEDTSAGNDDEDEDDDIPTGSTGSGDDDEDDEEDDDVTSGGGDEDDDEDEDDDDVASGVDDEDDDASSGDDEDDDDTATPAPNPVPATGSGGLRVGTAQTDALIGTAGADNMIGLAGDDVLIGDDGDDAISAGEGADFVNAGAGRDTVFAAAGDDQVFGGAGADMIHGEDGADRIFGEAGDDMVVAGGGDDTVVGGAGNDLIVGEAGDGNDVYFGDESDGGSGTDTLDMSAITANLTIDLGNGLLGRGSAVSAQSGNDTLWSIENVAAGSGDDTITAGEAVNVMEGGAGTDTFRFKSAHAADGDTVLDFEPGDRLDLGGIDADTTAAGNQSFSLVSGPAFTASAQLMVSYEVRDGVDYTIVKGNVDAGTDEEFRLELKGSHTLTGSNVTL